MDQEFKKRQIKRGKGNFDRKAPQIASDYESTSNFNDETLKYGIESFNRVLPGTTTLQRDSRNRS